MARTLWAPDRCSDKATLHTNDPSEPAGYVGWHEWAAKKGRTHRQRKCPTCGLYAIWVPKEAADA